MPKAIIPSREEDWTYLSRTQKGTLFRKHLLNMGQLRHPVTGKAINIDDAFVDTMIRNFEDGVCDIVQVPLAGPKNEHTEDPSRNIGEVIGLNKEDGKVYALIDARDKEAAEKLGKTLLGVSAMLHQNYTDTRTGKQVGPTLLHACVTNRPYVTNLEDYEQVVAATNQDNDDETVVFTSGTSTSINNPTSADSKDSLKTKETDNSIDDANTIRASSNVETPEVIPMTREELIAALKDEHGIDVAALQEAVVAGEAAAQLSQTLADQLADALKDTDVLDLSNGVTGDDLVGAVVELANTHTVLNDRVQNLEKKNAEVVVDSLVSEGYVLPAKRDTFVELKLSQPALFDALIPDVPVIKMTAETGSNVPHDEAHEAAQQAEIDRYAQMASELVPQVGRK